MPSKELTQIGRVNNTLGLKGEMKVEPLTSYPEDYLDLKTIFVLEGEIPREVKIKKLQLTKGKWILALEGVNRIEDAEKLKGQGLYLNEEDLVPLDEDEFFVHDLLHAAVYSEKDEYLGEVVDYFETGANGVCEVKNGEDSFLFPTTQEVLQEILKEENKIIIKVLPGLLDTGSA